jgi:uncharacterized membrane protein
MIPPELDRVLSRNIHALLDARRTSEQQRTREQRIADAITRFTGSMAFVYLHAVLFVSWLVVNLRLVPGIRAFDPFPFVMLAMIASVEAIFLSTFVLISQNRMGSVTERRAELDLQINLLAEHELTKLIATVDAMALKMGVEHAARKDLAPLEHDVTPETVLHGIDKVSQARAKEGGGASAPDADAPDVASAVSTRATTTR